MLFDEEITIIVQTDSTAPVQSVNGKIGFVAIDKSDVGLSNVENVSILGASGYLQSQINNISGGGVTGDYYPNSNPSGFITGIDLSSLYPRSNPSGFVTGVDLSALYPRSNPSGFVTGVDLSSLYPRSNPSGFVTGVDLSALYPRSNPSGFITGVDTSNFYTKDNPSGFITGVDTSNFYTKDNPSGFITGVDLSALYPRSNPSGFVTGVDLSSYATISNLATTGSTLSTNLTTTGSTLNTQINNLSGVSVLTYGNQTIDGVKTFRNSVYIHDLYVTGTEFIANVQNNFIESSYILLNLTGGAVDGGIFFVTGSGLTGVNDYGPIIGFDHTDKFKFGIARRSDDLSTLNDIAAFQDITNYSGFVDNKYATILNLESTGSNLQNQINNLNNSGFITGIENLVYTTGDQIIGGVKIFVDNNILRSGIAIGDNESTNLPIIKMWDGPNATYGEVTWSDYILSFRNYPDGGGNIGGNAQLIYNFGVDESDAVRTIAVDERVVHNFGNETISGIKTFISTIYANQIKAVSGSIFGDTFNIYGGDGINFGGAVNIQAGTGAYADGTIFLQSSTSVNRGTNKDLNFSLFKNGDNATPVATFTNSEFNIQNGLSLKISGITIDPTAYVDTTGNQTIGGLKTFSSGILVTGGNINLAGEDVIGVQNPVGKSIVIRGGSGVGNGNFSSNPIGGNITLIGGTSLSGGIAGVLPGNVTIIGGSGGNIIPFYPLPNRIGSINLYGGGRNTDPRGGEVIIHGNIYINPEPNTPRNFIIYKAVADNLLGGALENLNIGQNSINVNNLLTVSGNPVLTGVNIDLSNYVTTGQLSQTSGDLQSQISQTSGNLQNQINNLGVSDSIAFAIALG